MISPAESEALSIMSALATLAAGAYLFYHAVRYTVLAVNRGIDRDRASDHSGSPRGQSPPIFLVDYTAWIAIPPAAPAEPDDYWREVYARDHARMQRESHRGRVARQAGAGREPVARPGRPLPLAVVPPIVRPSRPVVVVSAGAFAGARVRLLAESGAYPGEWYGEVLDGAGRGRVTVVPMDSMSRNQTS